MRTLVISQPVKTQGTETTTAKNEAYNIMDCRTDTKTLFPLLNISTNIVLEVFIEHFRAKIFQCYYYPDILKFSMSQLYLNTLKVRGATGPNDPIFKEF